jgi:hypothetical protein
LCRSGRDARGSSGSHKCDAKNGALLDAAEAGSFDVLFDWPGDPSSTEYFDAENFHLHLDRAHQSDC